jgi:hypothetical protein
MLYYIVHLLPEALLNLCICHMHRGAHCHSIVLYCISSVCHVLLCYIITWIISFYIISYHIIACCYTYARDPALPLHLVHALRRISLLFITILSDFIANTSILYYSFYYVIIPCFVMIYYIIDIHWFQRPLRSLITYTMLSIVLMQLYTYNILVMNV